MSESSIDPAQLKALADLLSTPKNIAITAHHNPDGDAVGSVLGLGKVLHAAGHQVHLILPNRPPFFLEWMPGFERIRYYDAQPKEVAEDLASSDLLFCLDFNQAGRVGQMAEALLSAKFKVLIDHHQAPDDFTDLTFSDTGSCATCQLIHDVLVELGLDRYISAEAATNLYTGIMTDSGSFRYRSTSAHTHRVAAALIDKGVEPDHVQSSIFNTNSLDKTRLWGFALSEKLEFLEQHNAAIISLSLAELGRFNHRPGDTEGLVNQGLAIQGARLAAFFKQADGFVKMSVRSTGSLPVNELLKENFNGGGHINAAGGRSDLSLEDTVKRFKELLPNFMAAHPA